MADSSKKVYASKNYVHQIIENELESTLGPSDNAASASKLQTARAIQITGGANSDPIKFDGTQDVNLNINNLNESYIEWGTKNLVGKVSPIDAALVQELNANRLAFIDGDCITIEYSTDKGETWTDSGLDKQTKASLFTLSGDICIGGPSAEKSANNMARITITLPPGKLYFRMKKMLIRVSTGGASGTAVTLERAAYNAADTFTLIGTYPVQGWSGWNVIPLDGAFGGWAETATTTQSLRLTFSCTNVSAEHDSKLLVQKIRLYGDEVWTVGGNYIAETGNLYDYNMNKDVFFPASVTATQLIENGSPISTTYATKTELNNIMTTITNLNTSLENVLEGIE